MPGPGTCLSYSIGSLMPLPNENRGDPCDNIVLYDPGPGLSTLLFNMPRCDRPSLSKIYKVQAGVVVRL